MHLAPASKTHSKRCCVLHSAAKRCWGAPQQREAAERSGQRATQQQKAYLLTCCCSAAAPSAGVGIAFVANEKIGKELFVNFFVCDKKPKLLKPVLRKGWGTGVQPVLQIAALFPGTLCR
jgi:hypothetical protein